MKPGDVASVPDCSGIYYIDTGMYDTAEYGSVYVIDADRPALIDTGMGTNRGRLYEALERLDVQPEYIIPTHVHLDHAGGAGFLANRYPEATVLIHERGVPHLVSPGRLVAGTKEAVGDQWEFYTEPEPVSEGRIAGLTDGDTVDLGNRTLDVLEAVGHAPHQAIFRDRQEEVVFTADAAGIYVPQLDELRVTTPPPQFDLEQCHADVDMIRELGPRLLCFGHFGPREFDRDLLAGYKRRLLEWVEAVKKRRAELNQDEEVVEHFASTVPDRTIEVWGERKARAEARLNTRGVLAYLEK